MDRGEYFKMVKTALTILKPTRGTFFGIWCYIIKHFRITNKTKANYNVKEILKSGVKDGTLYEYVCRGATRYKLNMDKTFTNMKSHTETVKLKTNILQEKERGPAIKSPNTNGRPNILTNKRKRSSASSRPKKIIKNQNVSNESATEIEDTQSRNTTLLVLNTGFWVKLPDDRWDSVVQSIDVTPDGRILVVDRRIKLFDNDGKILSTLKINLFNGPHAVAAISNDEAVCTVMPDSEIYILDIRDNKLAIKDTIRVLPRSWVSDVSVYGDKFIVTNGTRSLSVQLIDRQGMVIWSRQKDDHGVPLMKNNVRLTSFIEEGNLKIVIVDGLKKRLVKLEGDTGEVVMVTKLFEKDLMATTGITHDGKGLLYVANTVNDEIYTWNYELTECNLVLSKAKGLRDKPSCLKYDASNEQLIVSYANEGRNIIDIYRAARTCLC